jgi:hypothetical protein
MRSRGVKAGAVTILAACAIVWLVLVGAAWAFQRRLVYFPARGPVPGAASFVPGAEDVTVRTEDGLELGGWFVPCRRTGRNPAILLLNGNAGDRSDRAPLAAALARAGIAVMLVDYRGYGGNAGSPSEDGLAADARAAVRALEARDDVDPDRIAYLGESLGAAVAVRLATERPPGALVLRSPFTTLADVGTHHYRFLPVRTLLRDSYPSIERIARVSCPLLVISGGRDAIVPSSMSLALFEAAREPKRLFVIEGADHNDFDLLAGPRMIEAVTTFLAEHLPPEPR